MIYIDKEPLNVTFVEATVMKADLEITQLKLTAEDYTDLGKQQLVGDLLYSPILSCFVLKDYLLLQVR